MAEWCERRRANGDEETNRTAETRRCGDDDGGKSALKRVGHVPEMCDFRPTDVTRTRRTTIAALRFVNRKPPSSSPSDHYSHRPVLRGLGLADTRLGMGGDRGSPIRDARNEWDRTVDRRKRIEYDPHLLHFLRKTIRGTASRKCARDSDWTTLTSFLYDTFSLGHSCRPKSAQSLFIIRHRLTPRHPTMQIPGFP